MNFSARLTALVGISFALGHLQTAQALTKVQVSKLAQSVTVMIQNAQNPQDSGSGIIIKRDGQTYTVLTAHHVVQRSSAFKVMTPDKKFYPMMQGSVQALPGVDLALVKFNSSEAYAISKMGDSNLSPSGSASFVAGFPGTTVVRSEPEYYFTSGEIAANGSRPNKDGYALVYSNPTLPGMSGGPVLNEKGELIGIHGRAERVERLQNSQLRDDIAVLKTEFNYAIPVNTFLNLAPQVTKALALRTPSPSMTSALKADDFFLQANAKYKAGNLSGAVSDYSQAILLNPRYASAYVSRGLVRQELGDEQGMVSDFNSAIQSNARSALAYSVRGVTRYKKGDPKGAIADLEQAINLDSRYAHAYLGRGFVRFEMGDKQGAISDLKQAAELYQSQGDVKAYQGVLKNLQQINGR
ncbi:MAG: tetratricopeptide repeat-containing serine protease family protein [Thermosynechococcaceae cyanobacterium MS004]|nr:tetratricopeptide repeat-containing serine protease family protein [Thermosynechococcaceae cyanobacterium MS004]